MKKVFLSVLLLLVLSLINTTIAQGQYRDVVQTKNGSIIKGIIIEQIPNESIKVETSDGNVFVFQMSEVEKITKEKILNEPMRKTTMLNTNKDINVKLINTTALTRREPALAWFGSFFVPGVGQFYNGQTTKGVAHLIWGLGSITLMSIGAFGIVNESYNYTYYNYYNESYIAGYATLMFVSSISYLTCWIFSQVDAALTADKINRQLGVANIDLGKIGNLSLNPDIKLVNTHFTKITPSYGLNLKLSF